MVWKRWGLLEKNMAMFGINSLDFWRVDFFYRVLKGVGGWVGGWVVIPLIFPKVKRNPQTSP